MNKTLSVSKLVGDNVEVKISSQKLQVEAATKEDRQAVCPVEMIAGALGS